MTDPKSPPPEDVRALVERLREGSAIIRLDGAWFPHAYELEQAATALTALLARAEGAERERDEALGDVDEYRDLLHDLVMLDAEEWAIGGGPGFKERRDKAWSAARERFEP